MLGEFLYALYGDNDDTAIQFGPGKLFRLSINSATGTITFDANDQIDVGINPQSIIPVNDGNAVYLLIPAIGGPQDLSGQTNGRDSDIWSVPATRKWPGTARIALTGDTTAAALRDGSSAIFILTQIYDNKGSTALWRIYRTSVKQFLIFRAIPLSQAVTAGNLTVVDEGTVTSKSTAPEYFIPFGIYSWDMLYE